MARTHQTPFATVRSEGGLLPPDLLARITAADPDLPGLAPEAYGLAKGERLNEAAARAWERVKAYWQAFKAATEGLPATESGVTETREQWLLPLFRELGYGRLQFRQAAEEIDGRPYRISHQAGEGPLAPPAHAVSFRQELDRAGAGDGGAGRGRTSPHTLLQEYLNRTDHVWGVVSNGKRLRLLRDNQALSRAAFVEFDLEAMLDGGVYADFVLLFLLAHRSRLPRPGERPEACWLERWREAAEERGARALDDLRAGVEAAIRALGQGLLEHPKNAALREKLTSGALPVEDYYRQLLRLVYRFLFLLAAEDRGLLFEDETGKGAALYRDHYGIGRLRELVEQRRRADRHDDLWRSLRVTFAALRDEATGGNLGLKPLAGGLFGPESCPDLDSALLANARLLEAIRGLTFTTAQGTTRRINYRDMDVEELGSVYEGLLESQPVLSAAAERPTFTLGGSGERKSTGSYYTNPRLVAELIRNALEPVIAVALASGRTPEEKRRKLLELKVCDPACGSGHFLLAAARQIGREVARLEVGESEPDPETTRRATREAIAHCVYGVDLNPLAVDLCKLALWLEAHVPGRPIGFLDHHVRHGNSLVGATAAVMAGGVPDAAFDPVTGDDKPFARDVKKRNAAERKGQRGLEELGWNVVQIPSVEAYRRYVASMAADDNSVEDVATKAAAYNRHRRGRDFLRRQLIADLWTAAFFWPLRPGEPQPPTDGSWQRLAADPNLVDFIDARKTEQVKHRAEYRTVRRARALARRHAFFHWELEFEEVFAGDDPGFDCVLGNPPWERVKLQEQEFFAARDPEIATAPNAAARKKLIAALEHGDERQRALWTDYRTALRAAEAESAFLRRSGRYPKTGTGDVNLYSVFAEHAANVVAQSGRAGMVLPTGIATDDTNKAYFGWLVREGRLRSLFDFENREGLFPGVHRSYKFSLLTLGGTSVEAAFDAAFFLPRPQDLADPARRFRLTAAEIALLNPNTRTCPIFRTARDAEITKAIYRAAPVLVREGPPEINPWGVSFKRMFDMSNDSHLFRTRGELEAEGGRLGEDGRFRLGGEAWLPLYEAKLIHQFDHRFATYEGAPGAERTRDLTPAEKADPTAVALPRYWVREADVERVVGSGNQCWFIGFRDITNATNERTAIFSVVPWAGVGNNLPILPSTAKSCELAGLLANLNTPTFDFAARQKVGGTHMNFFIVKQLPVLPPETYTPALLDEIVPRVLELTYTAWDLQPFARDLGHDGPPFVWDEERRALLRADLDGIYARLYGLSREDFAYVLDTFPIVERKDRAAFGEYRTKRLCLEAYDRFEWVREAAGTAGASLVVSGGVA